jgi:hypothetical protein
MGDHAVLIPLWPRNFCFTIGIQMVTLRDGLRRAALDE